MAAQTQPGRLTVLHRQALIDARTLLSGSHAVVLAVEFSRWLKCGENLFVSLVGVDGRHHIYQTSRIADALHVLERMYQWVQLRRADCAIDTYIEGIADMEGITAFAASFTTLQETQALSAMLDGGEPARWSEGKDGARNLVVPGAHVSALDVAPTLRLLDEVAARPSTLKRLCMNMGLTVDTPVQARDLAVFMQRLKQGFPWWPALARYEDYDAWMGDECTYAECNAALMQGTALVDEQLGDSGGAAQQIGMDMRVAMAHYWSRELSRQAG